MNNEEMELFCYLQDDEDYENDFEQDYKRLLREDIPILFDYIKKKDKKIARLNNIIKNLDKMFEYYFLGNSKYDQDTVNTIYVKYVKLKELKEEGK